MTDIPRLPPTRAQVRKLLTELFFTESDLEAFAHDHSHAYRDNLPGSTADLEARRTKLLTLMNPFEIWTIILKSKGLREKPPVQKLHADLLNGTKNLEEEYSKIRQEEENLANQNIALPEPGKKRLQEIEITFEAYHRKGDLIAERYLLIERCGMGSMADVWRAVDTKATINEPEGPVEVAIRLLRTKHKTTQREIERFRAGTALLKELESRIEGRVLVKVLQTVEVVNGELFAVMEYMPGGSLRDLLRQPNLTIEQKQRAMRILLATGPLLDRFHNLNTVKHPRSVHLDIKPSNILLDKQDQPLLNDLDEAATFRHGRFASNEGETKRTYTRGGGLKGIYVAPEVRYNEPKIDASADVFSLGMTAVAILGGAEPHEQWVNREHAYIDMLNIPAEVKKILLEATDVASKRPKMAGVFCTALERALTAENFFKSCEETLAAQKSSCAELKEQLAFEQSKAEKAASNSATALQTQFANVQLLTSKAAEHTIQLKIINERLGNLLDHHELNRNAGEHLKELRTSQLQISESLGSLLGQHELNRKAGENLKGLDVSMQNLLIAHQLSQRRLTWQMVILLVVATLAVVILYKLMIASPATKTVPATRTEPAATAPTELPTVQVSPPTNLPLPLPLLPAAPVAAPADGGVSAPAKNRAPVVGLEQAEPDANPSAKWLAPPREIARVARILVPGGILKVKGKPNEQINVAPFEMDRYEVTRDDYLECQKSKVCTEQNGVSMPLMSNYSSPILGKLCTAADVKESKPGDDHKVPINCVDSKNAATYCRWLNKRLPTEVEWEFAARYSRGKEHIYPWGDKFRLPLPVNGCGSRCIANLQKLNYFNLDPTKQKVYRPLFKSLGFTSERDIPDGDGYIVLAPVAEHVGDCTPDGICGLGGNVSEWTETSDCENEHSKAIRGGAWTDWRKEYFSVGHRVCQNEYYRSPSVGFRCVRDVQDSAANLSGSSSRSAATP